LYRETVRTIDGFNAEDLYAIAADFEAYPNFLPLCLAMRIRKREADRLHVDNRFGLGPARASFRTVAEFDPPNGIDIRSTDHPFQSLVISWRFDPVATNSCRVTFTVDQVFRPGPFGRLAEMLATLVERDVIGAFEKRAKLLAKKGPSQGISG